MGVSRAVTVLGLAAGLLLVLNSGYLAARAEPTLWYLANVALHTIGGLLLIPLLLLAAWRLRCWCVTHAALRQAHLATAGFWLLSIGLLAGATLIALGNYRPQRWLLYGHIVWCSAAVAAFLVALAGYHTPFTKWQRRAWWLAIGATGIAVLAPGILLLWRTQQPDPYQITNPLLPPLSQDDEGMGGQKGPFHPAGVFTTTGGAIPSDFFLTSERCADCHADIYQQWSQSAHRFSSFNNPWYSKSIEYMQDVLGTRPTRWCAGCHDVAPLLSGMMDTPVRDMRDTPEAHAGLACTACHAMTQVRDTMGNGDYLLAYPALHDLMASENRLLHWLHDFLVRVDPAPHRGIFLKPFHRGADSPAFCATCHKAHLDTHVNNYRWVRGFNEYDAWQNSGVSGASARSFYYPAQPQTCNACHMPLVPSNDLGNRGGYVHSHRFPAANTALPTLNQHPEQLQATTAFLQRGVVALDLFAVHAGTARPLRTVPITVPGEKALRVDVVVRNRSVGHAFPAGTSDAFDVWVEFKAVDELGQVLFWSGAVADSGRGPVDPKAHFYRAFLVDQHGNVINKRNAWAARAVVYNNAIPPGSADVVRFRLPIPDHAGERLTLTAKLHYRKFRWWYTQWTFVGERDPQQPTFGLSPHYDDGRWIFDGERSTVHGLPTAIPNVPIVTMASTTATLRVTADREPIPAAPLSPAHSAVPVERWNDYGIGLLRQGDLRGAEAAFVQVTQHDPAFADGWVNLGRTRLRDGDPDGARRALDKALVLAPALPRALFFLAMVLKTEGDYEGALARLYQVAAVHPNDRVVRNQMGRLLFLLGRYHEARAELEQVLRIDPEDLRAHYNLMLCFRALGDETRAATQQRLYQRFKADESSSVIAGIARQRYPSANTESQSVHEHHTMP